MSTMRVTSVPRSRMLFKRVLWVPCHEHDWVKVTHWDCACEF